MICRRYANVLVLFLMAVTTGCVANNAGASGSKAENNGIARAQYADANLDVKHINDCVYEIIVPKPPDQSITYEKPLPLDQLPFQVRNDKYWSIGTAFAYSATEFATAAHVMNIASRSRFKDVSIRDSKGNVFGIDKIMKYSSRRDFLVFTVKGRQNPEYLEANQATEIGGKVFAVGNALGQGVVIRDGLYTSNTPEEIDGKWNWIRFSAAASPGNSGGPLLDSNGKVIGIVLLKSPNENLNYALPIAEVNRDYGNNAEIFFKVMYGLEIFDFVKKAQLDTKVGLPLSYDDLKKACTTSLQDLNSKTTKELLAENKANTFPNGSGSDKVFTSSLDRNFPQLIMRGENGNWEPSQPREIKNVDLDNNGKIYYGITKLTLYAKLDKPDNIPLKSICNDSKLLMDLMLKAMPMHRQFGQEIIRITSFGKADNEYSHIDAYGRKWLVRTWPSYLDQEMIAFVLPLPDGCAVMLKAGQSGHVFGTCLEDMKILADFVSVPYYGTFKQWREYLEMKDIAPSAFNNIQINMDNGSLMYSSNYFQSKCDCNDMKLTDNSMLKLIFGYRKKGDSVAWDVKDIWIREGKFEKTDFGVHRHAKPGGNDEKSSNWWARIIEEKKPFDRQVVIKDDTTIIRAVCKKPQSTGANSDRSVLYSVKHTKNGTVSQEEMQSELDRFMKTVVVKEN